MVVLQGKAGAAFTVQMERGKEDVGGRGRLTLVKGWNMEEVRGYAGLVELGLPDFIEIKVGPLKHPGAPLYPSLPLSHPSLLPLPHPS